MNKTFTSKVKVKCRPYLKVPDNTLSPIENLVKQQLLFNLNFYLNKHVGQEQNQATLKKKVQY